MIDDSAGLLVAAEEGLGYRARALDHGARSLNKGT